MSQTWEDVEGRPAVATGEGAYQRVGADFAPLPLRLMLGFGFMWHGFPKLFSVAGHQGFIQLLDGLGIPLPGFFAWAVGILEFFGGLLLVLGLMVSPIAFLAVIEMLVAVFALHLEAGFNFMNVVGMGPDGPIYGMPGFEVPLLYAAGFLALVFSGAGAWSIDRAVQRKRPDGGHPWVGMRQPSA